MNDLWKFDPLKSEWAWMGGSSLADQYGVYGTQGAPAAGNAPGARDRASSWTDNSGHLWLFGGEGFDAIGQLADLNDLWEFDPPTNEWVWLGGGNVAGQSGVYGTLGAPATMNAPGSRQDAATWTGGSGNLWLFGGGGAVNGLSGELNDLWEFNPSTNEWAWMSGSSTVGQPAVYGTLGVPAPGNIPASRDAAVSWTDNHGNLWLFGGWDVSSSAQTNDLWEYQP
jgi:hypothetical protein